MDEIYRDILKKLGTEEAQYVLEPSLDALRVIILDELLWTEEVDGVDVSDAVIYLGGESTGLEQTQNAQRLIDPILKLYFNKEEN